MDQVLIKSDGPVRSRSQPTDWDEEIDRRKKELQDAMGES